MENNMEKQVRDPEEVSLKTVMLFIREYNYLSKQVSNLAPAEAANVILSIMGLETI